MSSRPAFLQSYVVPLVLFKATDGAATVVRLYGTAFFINGDGLFLTAKHVIRSALEDSKKDGLTVGLVTKDPNGLAQSFATPIFKGEGAPGSSDIAVGWVPIKTSTPLRLTDVDATLWQSVATLGYPDEATSGSLDRLRFNVRAQRGIVQRKMEIGDFPSSPDCEAYELDFLLARGMSGAPVFVYAETHDIVVGVCVGTWQSETVIDSETVVCDDKNIYREISKNINRYGVAERVSPLLNWKPSIFRGHSLREFLSGERPTNPEIFVGQPQFEIANLEGNVTC